MEFMGFQPVPSGQGLDKIEVNLVQLGQGHQP